MGLPSIGSVNSNSVNCLGVFAKILDMAENMPSAILADEITKVGSKTHVCNGRLMIAPFLNRESFEENEALSIEYLGADGLQCGG